MSEFVRRYLCPECGEDSISINTYLEWSFAQQSWVRTHPGLDRYECGVCHWESDDGGLLVVLTTEKEERDD